MKKTGVASPSLILFIWGSPLLCLCLLVPLMVMDKGLLLPFIVFCFLVASVQSYRTRNAYRWYRISENGVKNRRLELSWENINSIDICCVRKKYGKSNDTMLQFTSVVCLGDMNSDQFEKLNPRLCVFFSLTKKNLDALLQCANGRCPAIEKLYHEYYDYVK